ncbi:hypothetical protein WJX73_002422 [Symbiochloris irregularis]|uniref:Uncharacterized protein n=1 Tax=Symbiochloris irregularis TaxID=706552 RepID=A0AAW1NXQ8_9CHLO
MPAWIPPSLKAEQATGIGKQSRRRTGIVAQTDASHARPTRLSATLAPAPLLRCRSMSLVECKVPAGSGALEDGNIAESIQGSQKELKQAQAKEGPASRRATQQGTLYHQSLSMPPLNVVMRRPIIDRVSRFREMQQMWGKDPFLKSGGDSPSQRRPRQGFREAFQSLHLLEAAARTAQPYTGSPQPRLSTRY